MTPGAGRTQRGLAAPTTSTGRRLFSPQDKTYAATRANAIRRGSIFSTADAGATTYADGDDESASFDDITGDSDLTARTAHATPRNRTAAFQHDDEDDNFDDDRYLGDDTTTSQFDMSPPKTMQFHVPQSRLLQTPAREASRRIVDDLLMTAGADATDEIEGAEGNAEAYDAGEELTGRYGRLVLDGFEDDDDFLTEEGSPSLVVKRAQADDTF
jgi:DASH complex subunit ASK1